MAIEEKQTEAVATEEKPRRLVAVLSAGLEANNRQGREPGTQSQAAFDTARMMLDDSVTAHAGRLVPVPGESILVEFLSIEQAIHCAVAIQTALAAHHETLAPAEHIRCRIGINHGEVLVHDAQIYGQQVNIASQLEALTEWGGVTLSHRAYETVSRKLEVQCDFFGERKLEKIKHPVGIYQMLHQGISTPEAMLPRRPRGFLPGTPWAWVTGLALVLLLISITLQHFQD